MCYSAQVVQLFKKLTRLTGAKPDWAQAEMMFHRRLTDPSIKVSRALEANFDHPENEVEQRIKGFIDEFRSRQWAAPGFVDTLFRAMMRNEVEHATSIIYARVQDRGGEAGDGARHDSLAGCA